MKCLSFINLEWFKEIALSTYGSVAEDVAGMQHISCCWKQLAPITYGADRGLLTGETLTQIHNLFLQRARFRLTVPKRRLGFWALADMESSFSHCSLYPLCLLQTTTQGAWKARHDTGRGHRQKRADFPEETELSLTAVGEMSEN